MDHRIVRRTLSRLAEDTLVLLGDNAVKILSDADRLARQSLSPAQIQSSRVLPLAFLDRCKTLAVQAAEGKAISGQDIAWLGEHRVVRLHHAELAVLEPLARLSRYQDEPFSPQTDVVAQVREYHRSGAFADLAMVQLRRALASNVTFRDEASKVLAAAREKRDSENKHFAETLAQGYEAALHKPELTPLHRIWKRTVSPLWEKEPDALVYLIVLDGCSYPVFLEILYALSQQPLAPIGIAPDADGRVCGIPALAPLPTITSHARGAIFLGELPNDTLIAETVFRDDDEPKTDKARFNTNQALGNRRRELFLKGDLSDNGQALLTALSDESIGVVAAVFNAIDDQIGSSNTGTLSTLDPKQIAGFLPSLKEALKHNRHILLTADHGHTLYVDKNLRRDPSAATPRYVSLAKKNAAPDGFLEIDLGGLGGPPERRAFAWKSGVYASKKPQVGFHGGCGLEEMAVPLAWLQRDGLCADVPSWWYGGGAIATPVAHPLPVEPPLVTPIPSDDVAPVKRKPQLKLFDAGDKAVSLPISATVLAKLSVDEKAVLVLLFENKTARSSELATKLNKNPGRLNGLMRNLRRTLHSEGLVLFTDEILPTGETMYSFKDIESKP
jgi:hypothetical protein